MATRGWEKVTREDLIQREVGQALTRRAQGSKFRNVKTVMDGERFDSRHEADEWTKLRLLEQAGELRDLRRQVRFALYAPEVDPDTLKPTGALLEVAEYVADYVCVVVATGQQRVIDAKGQRRRICPYPLKKKWMRLQYGIDIEEV